MACSRCGGWHADCDPCYVTTGCPLQLDFSCVLYHKNNNEVTELDGLGLSNGATLELVVETIDEKVKQLNVLNFNLACLRQSYVINTMQQFCEAVDTEICSLKTRVTNLGG